MSIPQPQRSSVHWLSPNEYAEWDTFVTRHPLGLIYHLSSWQQVLGSTFGHIRGRFLVLRNGSGQIQAGLPVYTVKSWLLGNRTVSLPFATICDPLISTREEFNLLWPAVQDTASRHRSRRVEIRTRQVRPEILPSPLAAGTRYKHHYLSLKPSVDELFRSFSKTTVRQRVEQAKRAGVAVELRSDDDSLRTLHALLVATRRRHSLPPMPFGFFQAMYRALAPDHAELSLALHDGRPVAGMLVLKFRDMWTSEYSGTADHAINGVGQLLNWDAIQRARGSGANYFSFGRTSLDNGGLLDHKRRWATVEEDLTDFMSGKDVRVLDGEEDASKSGGRTLYDTAVRLFHHAPPALQKSFGDFCYRHLG
jgi:hypothetical protein